MPKYKIILTIVFSVSVLFGIVLLIGAYTALNYTSSIANYSELNTQEYVATVSSIQIISNSKNKSIRIFTKEFSAYLETPSQAFHNIDSVKILPNGEKIRFRIPSSQNLLLHTGTFVQMVSLETQAVTLLSLENYNAFLHEDISVALIALCIITGIEFLLALSFGLSMLKTTPKRRDGSSS